MRTWIEKKTELLGVPISDVYDTLQTLFGSLYVNQFPKSSRLWQVILQAEPEYRMSPKNIDQIYVRNEAGHMVPLSALVKTDWTIGPDIVTRFNNYPAAKITGGPAAGVSSGQALEIMEQLANDILPEDYSFEWAGESREEKMAGGTSAIAFTFGLIFVFLILAAQYESWTLPFGVLMAVPFALLGALLAIVGKLFHDFQCLSGTHPCCGTPGDLGSGIVVESGHDVGANGPIGLDQSR